MTVTKQKWAAFEKKLNVKLKGEFTEDFSKTCRYFHQIYGVNQVKIKINNTFNTSWIPIENILMLSKG